jgi:hypothetical protein
LVIENLYIFFPREPISRNLLTVRNRVAGLPAGR